MTGLAGRINLITACFVPGFVFDADTLFKVAHGFAFSPWSEFSPQEKRAANHPSSTFVLLIDGEEQKSALHAALDQSTDTKLKILVSEYHKGLPAGDYTFTIEFYIDGFFLGGDFRDAVLLFACDMPATFV